MKQASRDGKSQQKCGWYFSCNPSGIVVFLTGLAVLRPLESFACWRCLLAQCSFLVSGVLCTSGVWPLASILCPRHRFVALLPLVSGWAVRATYPFPMF